ncbi:MAG: flavodoxin family protein [bacterium]|nr:flavodoxin family protein [bacterium]
MKITVFNGSPRAEKGNTHIMVEEFLSGAKEAGAETENIFLVKNNIKHCLGCYNCWIQTPGECIIKDDMKELLSKFIETDIVVFATPLYVDNVSGIMKNFMDRLIPVLDPYFKKDENGECRHTNRYNKSPKIVVISNSGFPEQSHFQVLQLLFRRIAKNMQSEVIGEIYRGGGPILGNKMLLLTPFIHNYKKCLHKAGKEIVENLKLSDETIQKLEKPIIPDEQYISGANKSWDKTLAKIKDKL